MYPFEYHRPATLKEAVSLLRKIEDSKVLSGGQSLIPALKFRLSSPAALIDLGGVEELRGIKLEGATLTIGAMIRHAEVASSPDVMSGIPALAKLAAGIGDRQVRNSGTLGGAIGFNDPAADYPAAVLGLGAVVHTNKRAIKADKFFTGLYQNALRPAEIITSIAFPLPKRAAYAKFRNPASRFAIVGVFVSESTDGVRVAVTGAASCVFRVKQMEKKLAKNFAPEAIARVHVPPDNLNSDLHASAEYRSHLITVMAQRAVQAALAGQATT
ncbi:MAG TPA: xanthine dehydrogenase family protein subunit M [Burkholderiales bacterium]|nr:xanthine dehydrogenase family protein subunit M [Burkholderiales bacterium]